MKTPFHGTGENAIRAGAESPDATRPVGDSEATAFEVTRVGRIDYRRGVELQARAREDVFADAPSRLILCEHPHVYTLGRQTRRAHLRLSEAEYRTLGTDVVECDRGGSVTYHGPGQLVAYPVFRLGDFSCGHDLDRFLRTIEAVIIDALASFGVASRRVSGKTGVWTEHGKIAAIGLKCSRWISSHGLALNVAPDLSYFGHIVPCGLTEPVTSMSRELAAAPPLERVEEALIAAFGERFTLSRKP